MIRRGKAEGWLQLPANSLKQWASFNGIEFNGVEVKPIAGRGSAVVALRDDLIAASGPLMFIPRDVVLSNETVQLHAKSDRHLRDVIDALDDFGRTPRGAMLAFLVVQATHSCPDLPETIGVANAFTEYIKFLPLELIPTFWTTDELELLVGTSLAPAIEAKMNSLYREFDGLRRATDGIEWCNKYWWDEVDGVLQFDDWLHVDAMYRSRALEFPGIGDAMVPCVDMANHASGDQTAALYEADASGNGLLLLRDQHTLQVDNEVTITYGDEKGACEMIFSYGFLEDDMQDARDVFLDLEIPDDDPLKRAKHMVSNSPPGVRLCSGHSGLRWEGEFIWLICVNEEDGLLFKVAVTTDGERELKVTWNDTDLSDTSKLRSLLELEPLWQIYQLRAISLLHDRVMQQLRLLQSTKGLEVDQPSDNAQRRDGPIALAKRLRQLEQRLLIRFDYHFDQEKKRLAESDAVQRYLAEAQADPREDAAEFA